MTNFVTLVERSMLILNGILDLKFRRNGGSSRRRFPFRTGILRTHKSNHQNLESTEKKSKE